MADIRSLFATRLYRARLDAHGPKVDAGELEASCLSIAEDDEAGQDWCEREGYPGDVILAYQTCAKEAQAAGISLIDHAAHLALHGVLHLNGFDHQEEDEAAAMEALETAVLTGLGIQDPYLVQE